MARLATPGAILAQPQGPGIGIITPNVAEIRAGAGRRACGTAFISRSFGLTPHLRRFLGPLVLVLVADAVEDLDAVAVIVMEIEVAAGEGAVAGVLVFQDREAALLDLGAGAVEILRRDDEGVVELGAVRRLRRDVVRRAPQHEMLGAALHEGELVRGAQDLAAEQVTIKGGALLVIAAGDGEMQDAFGLDHAHGCRLPICGRAPRRRASPHRAASRRAWRGWRKCPRR